MYGQFLKYINQNRLFGHNDRLLLGVSGGVDSVVLTHLINKHGNPFAIAHCNFHLRNEESDSDADFVSELANQYGVPYFRTDFDTRDYAESKGISIEMAARELRYNWFETMRREQNYDSILVAHHLDDVLETFLLNLSRGTGIRGLSGIKPKAGKIVRPLLFALRSDIELYASENQLESRFDSSNNDVLIKRNRIRHQIMPLMQELNPAFKRNFHKTIQILQQTEQVFLNEIERVQQSVSEFESELVKISISKLLDLNPLDIYLFELLKPYGFNADQCAEISAGLSRESGRQFFSPLHRLVVDRDYLIINEIGESQDDIYYIDSDQPELNEPVLLKLQTTFYTADYRFERNRNIAQLDCDKLVFPLVVRKWKTGEYFRPLGMQGMKKLSDFFIDQKLSIPEKESTWLVLSENKVVWVVGHRIDDRFKISNETQRVFQIEKID